MTICVDKITMDFNSEYYPSHCDRRCVRCKEWKNLVYFQRYYHAEGGRYLMQYKHTVTCCECLDAMREYNNKRKKLEQGKEK